MGLGGDGDGCVYKREREKDVCACVYVCEGVCVRISRLTTNVIFRRA